MTRNVGQQQPPQPQQVYDVIEPGKPNGARILFACRYDARLCASIIAVRDDWEKLVETITSPDQIKVVRHYCVMIRQGLGLGV